jgi:hypothetical protein
MQKIFIIILFIFGLFQIDAQSKLDIAIDNLEKNYSQEKVYILFDKDQYVAGDQLNFQSFVFDGYNLSSISKTLYVELYNQSKNLIDKKVILINEGRASGTFSLNKTLNEDIYFVRAYTNWMANFDSEWNFIKPIHIYNSTSKKKLVLSEESKWSITASPEGGTFIDQISTKIAVRLYSQGKSPKSWSGYLIDSEFPNEKLQSFKSLDENVAIFSMIPKFGKTYKIIVEDESGHSQITTLPLIQNSGVNLKIDNEQSGIKYTINAINLSNNLQNYTVVGIVSNRLAYKAKIKSKNQQVISTIPVNEIGQNGIMQISLFDEKDNLVAQRLSFLPLKKTNEITLENKNINNNTRTLNSFEIKQNSNHSSFTVLIKDITDLESSSKENILSHLFLQQDFKNPIKNPAQYFSKESNKEALDAILISEKWKRFDWTKLIAGQKPVIKYNLVDNEFISYKARLALNSRPLANTDLNLVFKNNDGEPLLSQFTTDQNGDIFINNLNFEESYFVNYFLNSNNKQQDNLTLKLKLIIETDISKLNFPQTGYTLKEVDTDYILPASVKKAFENAKNNEKILHDETMIEEVKIIKRKSDAIKKLNDELTSGMFSSMNANIFDFVNDNQDALASRDILQWLQGRVAGLQMIMVEPGKYMPVIRGVEAGIFLDEMNVDVEVIKNIDIGNIAMVKVIKGNILIGNSILVYTRTANIKPSVQGASKNNNKVEIKAYDSPTTFPTIDYSKDKYKNLINDWRQNLYWNPQFSNSKIIFFNNDNANNREITIIGFDKDDELLYYNEVIE